MKNDLETDGLFFGFNARLPEYQECQNSIMCKFAVKILGANTNIQFYSFVKTSMAKVVGRIAKLQEGTNIGKFRLSKIELFIEVNHYQLLRIAEHGESLLNSADPGAHL